MRHAVGDILAFVMLVAGFLAMCAGMAVGYAELTGFPVWAMFAVLLFLVPMVVDASSEWTASRLKQGKDIPLALLSSGLFLPVAFSLLGGYWELLYDYRVLGFAPAALEIAMKVFRFVFRRDRHAMFVATSSLT